MRQLLAGAAVVILFGVVAYLFLAKNQTQKSRRLAALLALVAACLSLISAVAA